MVLKSVLNCCNDVDSDPGGISWMLAHTSGLVQTTMCFTRALWIENDFDLFGSIKFRSGRVDLWL